MATQNLAPRHYEGREQAWIKHLVLENYLKQLTAILGVNQASFEFTYIDCFAGPWGDASESMSGTSIAISLKTLGECKTMLEERGCKVKMRALYVEESDSAYPRLAAYLADSTPQGVETHSIHGEFVQSREQILNWVGNAGFAFFFIDPKGWSEIKIATLKPLLLRPKAEFVINFMYDFINRTLSMRGWQSEMEKLMGEPLDLTQIDRESREETIVNTYSKNLKKLVHTAGNRPVRSTYATVADPRKERTKYHLVFVTTHPKGIIKFRETYEAASAIQDTMRAHIRDKSKEDKAGITDLFADQAPPFVDNSGIKALEPAIDAFWLQHIGIEHRYDETAFSDILEEKSWWSPAQLQASLVRLIAQSKVENLDASKPRRSKPLHYDVRGGERLRVISQCPPSS
jgi:three-Cys-motif partner protein